MNMTWPGVMWPTMSSAYVPQYNMAPVGVSGPVMQQQQQMGGQMGGGQVGNSDRKWRFPCDNCGNYGHWRHEVSCPNFHVYIARQHQRLSRAGRDKGCRQQLAANSRQEVRPWGMACSQRLRAQDPSSMEVRCDVLKTFTQLVNSVICFHCFILIN